MDRGQFLSRVEAEHTTFGEVIQRYIKVVTTTKRGCEAETIRLTAILRHRMAKLSMANLTPQVMAEFRDERLLVCRANTVNRDLVVLSSIINHARREWGICVQNPVAMIRKPTIPPGRDRVLSQLEEAALLEVLAPVGRRNPVMQDLVIVAIETAMRRGELLGVRWEHVNLEHRTVFLPLTKNGQPRYVPLSSRAVATLQGIQRRAHTVFPISIAALEANFYKAVRRAGLIDVRFHDLRHTAASRMASKLPNVIELAAVTGHTSLQMLKRYYHPKASELAKKLG
jgi:integrase